MATNKVHKILVTWASGDWRRRIEDSLRGPEYADRVITYCTERADILRELRDTDAAYVANFDAELLKAAPRLKWLHFMRGGVDNAIFPELVASPVVVTCLKELFSAPGAEFALMAMLMVQRRMTWSLGRPKLAQSTNSLDLTLKPEDFAGRTVAILGLGNIGRRIAELCRAFHARVLGTARHAPAQGALVDEFFPLARVGDMMARSDFTVLALPLTADTQRFFDAEKLALMKPGSWLIDVSARAALIDFEALRRALDSGRLGGVVLQPTGVNSVGVPPATDPLWQADNVMVSPCRCNSTEQLADSIAFFPANLRRFEQGEPLRGLVDKAAGY